MKEKSIKWSLHQLFVYFVAILIIVHSKFCYWQIRIHYLKRRSSIPLPIVPGISLQIPAFSLHYPRNYFWVFPALLGKGFVSLEGSTIISLFLITYHCSSSVLCPWKRPGPRLPCWCINTRDILPILFRHPEEDSLAVFVRFLAKT